MKNKSSLFLFSLLLIFVGCTEKFDWNMEGVSQRMVVEGVITNDSTLLVKVSKTDPNLGSFPLTIAGASVIVWSSAGDTLTLKEVSQGCYTATNTIGKTGNTYYLLVQYQGEEYKASSFMAPVPTLDSIAVKYSGIDRIRLFFKVFSDEEGFYLFRFEDPKGTWLQYVESNNFLNSDIVTKGYVVAGARSIDKKNSFIYMGPSPWDRLIISISSISEGDYNYYRSIEMQFSTNGGAYSPTPANPKGNISNGALGLFRASSISYITHYPDSI